MASLVRLLLDKMRMVKEDALAVAAVVEDAFKGSSEVDDSALDKDLRQVFYDLQDEKILEVRRDEVVEDGRARRHYYWRVRDESGISLGPVPLPAPAPEEKLYHKLSDAAWERRRPQDPDGA